MINIKGKVFDVSFDPIITTSIDINNWFRVRFLLSRQKKTSFHGRNGSIFDELIGSIFDELMSYIGNQYV